jgi:hypothetical protein
MEMHADDLKTLGFDLAYLTLLTKAGVKPLSRWEKDFTPQTEELLRTRGMKTRVVRRSVRSGKQVRELLFSRSNHCLDLYASHFDGTPIDRNPTTMRIEGLLFGYPSCCVERFVRNGYVRNSLPKKDQRILFHWACPRCPVTPLLLPYYRQAYRECRRAMRGPVLSALSSVHDVTLAQNLRRAVAAAASIIALTSLPSSDAKYNKGDPHWVELEAWEDPDGDFLKTDEEVLLHMDPNVWDEDGNLVADGVDVALALSDAIDALGDTPSADKPYVVHNMAFGLEACSACGEMVNMGFMQIVNPLENLSIDIPYVAKHYMEHGSFSYSGGIHTGRVNVAVLKTVLESEGLAHFIPEPVGTDADTDGLRDWEEPVLGTVSGEPDTDGDLILDGIDLARELRAQLDTLPRYVTKSVPYVIEHPMDGIETCPHCGAQVVMDIWEVVNPVTGATISISSMALHFMEHGGFSWEGGQLQGGQGRVDPRQLKAVLTGEGDGHLLHVSPDMDGDLLTDREELDLPTDPNDPDENGNSVLDGIELAKAAAAEVATLPDKPSDDQVYRLDFELKGLEWCDICGQNVNMGHLTVVNPMAQLYVKAPYISLHYMEHGSFSFAGNVHGKGRLDVKLLVEALHSSGPGHVLPVSDDSDGDGLRDREEEHFNTSRDIPDTDGDGLPDGFALAHDMWEAIGTLPRADAPEDGPRDETFVVEHLLRGLTTCDTCGSEVNMGWLEVINPRENLTVAIPYVGLHYMQRGSLSYTGHYMGDGPQGGRVNPCLLDIALRGDGTSHLVILPQDKDKDGLFDDEEAHFGCNPGLPDTDGDGVMDGVGLARWMHRQIQELPTEKSAARTYLIHYEADCFTHCSICEEEVNCGHIEVTNPLTGLSINIPYVELHFMEFGSFAAGREQRVDPVLLDPILRPGVVIAAGENQISLRWKGELGKSYQVFSATDLSGPWTAGPVLPGNGGDMSYVPEGQHTVIRSQEFYKILVW